MLRIYADFNSSDEEGRVMLNTVGSLADIVQHHDKIAEGMSVILYSPGDFEVRGTLTFEGIWMGIPDWSTIQYEDPKDAPR